MESSPKVQKHQLFVSLWMLGPGAHVASTAFGTGCHVGGTGRAEGSGRPGLPDPSPGLPPTKDHLRKGKESSCLAALLLQKGSLGRGAEPAPKEPWPPRRPAPGPAGHLGVPPTQHTASQHPHGSKKGWHVLGTQ